MKIIISAGHLFRHYSLFLAFFLSGIGILQAQEKEIQGTVIAEQLPLMGVAVQIQGTDIGVTTNIDGQYRIKVQIGDTLNFSHLGYKTRQILITNQSTLDIELEPDATALGVVEITGGYYSLNERTKTGNVAVVGRDQLDQQVIHSPLEALQGRVAGLEIASVSGMRGQAPDVILRGQSSVRGARVNKPLYIIDGVPIDNDKLMTFTTVFDISTAIDPMSTLDPSLIESIEVLKDADATAIYGSRGANGVIIINTKRGKSGKTKFEMQVETGVSWVGKFLDLMNTEQYLEMRREAFANDGVEPTEANAPDLLLWNQNKYTDWQKELLGGNAEFQKYQGTLSGGNQQTSFLLSGGFQKETTVFPGDFGFLNSNIHTNINHRSQDNKLRINSSIDYGYQKHNLFNAGSFVNKGITLSPNTPDLFKENGDINWEVDEYGNPTFDNPMAGLRNPNIMRLQTFRWNGSLDYRVFKGFDAKINLGFNQLYHNENEIAYKKNLNPIYADIGYSTTYNRKSERNQLIIEPQLNYAIHWKKHKINNLIGASIQKNKSAERYLMGKYYFSESQVGNFALAEEQNIIQDDRSDYHYAALFGRIGYSYDNKYFLNLTGRRDGSSRFGEKNRFGNFGAIGAAWDFYKEDWIAKILPKLSSGKIRGSYGVTGNDDIGNYQYRDTYTNIFVRSGSLSSGGLVPSKLYNPFYQWEKNVKMEFALQMGIWDDRLILESSWYRERTGNQLMNISLPSITGFSSVLGNFPATVQNTGLEFVIQVAPIKKLNFNWNTSANLTIPKNKLVSFPDIESSSYASRYIVGKPLGIMKMYHYIGIDPETGKYTFEDVNGDGVLNNDDKIVVADLSRKFYGGWYNNIQHRNWSLSFLFEFVKQKGMSFYPSFSTPGIKANMPSDVQDRWTHSNPNGKYQAYTQLFDSGFYDYTASDAMIIDASFIRLKSLSIAYDFPSSLLNNISVENARMYLNAQNLLTFTPYKGFDPQMPGSVSLPALTSLNIGLKLTL